MIMVGKNMDSLKENVKWVPPVIKGDIPHGDMPGDKVKIEEVHINKANTIFPKLLEQLSPILEGKEHKKAVITVCGGSGVGKSEIASLLSYYFNNLGIGSYTLSGDNYPHKIPKYNDAQRLQIFRESAIKGMVNAGEFSEERFAVIHDYQKKGDDANVSHVKEFSWYESYLTNGINGLKGYLGTTNEIGFEELNSIIAKFKSNQEKIWLRRMGREDTELWYEEVDFSNTDILIIEWTHGNSDYYEGVDVPILLNSTPQETLEHRKARNRDGSTDSPFTMLVLKIEQELLESQAHKAKIILSKTGEILDYKAYCALMERSRGECV
jgi:alpha-galactosidase